jgi:hypothetical protein
VLLTVTISHCFKFLFNDFVFYLESHHFSLQLIKFLVHYFTDLKCHLFFWQTGILLKSLLNYIITLESFTVPSLFLLWWLPTLRLYIVISF